MSRFKCKTCKCKFDIKSRDEIVCDRDDCPQMPHHVEKAEVIEFDGHEVDLDWEIIEEFQSGDLPPITPVNDDLEAEYWNRWGGYGG